eukprot:734878_1
MTNHAIITIAWSFRLLLFDVIFVDLKLHLETMLESSITDNIQPSAPTIWSQVKLRHIFSVSSTEYRGTQIFTALLVIGVFLGLNKFTRDSLSSDVSSVLIEAKILKLISSIFVSTEVLWSVFHVFIMIIFGSLIEKVRGTYSLLTFVIQICLLSEFLTLIIFLSLYYFSFDTFYLERKVCGFDAMFGAFVMCLTEISPNNVVIPNINILTFQYLPFTLAVIVTILQVIGLMGITQMCLILCGTWIGWGILRYFAPNLHDRYEKGNPSEEFELQYLFPPILRFPVRLIANITYAIFKNVGCCEVHSRITSKGNNIANKDNGLLSDNLNDLVLGLSPQTVEEADVESDTDNFTKSVMSNKYNNQNVDDVDAQKRQEAKNLIEKRLQQIQREYNQRIINSNAQTNQDNDP